MGGLGTFTTFSTFAADAVGLAGTRVGSRRGRSVGHVVNTLVLGVGAAALGLTIS
jgi:fluoride ion exporter CrcB/FEX